MGNIDDDFVRCLAALHPGDDVERIDPANFVADPDRPGHAQRDRLEAPNGRLLLRGLEVESGHFENRLGRGPLHPALDGGAAQVVVRSGQIE